MSASPAEVLCVGTVLVDTIALVKRLPDEDGRVEADRFAVAGGGNASTAAVTIARLGVDVEFAGVIGDDEAGETVVRQLGDEGVGTRHVVVRPGAETARSMVIVSLETGARTIVTKTAAPLTEIPRGYRMVHLDKAGYPALDATGPLDATVSLDDGGLVENLDLSLIDLYMPTAEILTARFSTNDPVAAARAAIDAGAGTVIATAGAAGSFAVSDGEAAFAPALSIRPVSSLGAGDVFHGAAIAALILGRTLPDAIRFANVTAALSCRGVDGRSGIPRRSEVEEVLKELPANGPAVLRTITRVLGE